MAELAASIPHRAPADLANSKTKGPSQAWPAKGLDGFPMVAHPDAKGAGLRSLARSVVGGEGRHLLTSFAALWLRKREIYE
jgi:hypothetical protein